MFSFAGERSASCLLDAGNIPIGRDLGVAYSGHFHLSDPNRDAIFEGQANAAPILLPTFARRMVMQNMVVTAEAEPNDNPERDLEDEVE